ncbi:MAG: sigma-70 family RNA polymerase sigma factor [Planctomycetales bacterium]|nr:sigma-70 family RNA polymerase sigma factor [Planctomycetales bacterium]
MATVDTSTSSSFIRLIRQFDEEAWSRLVNGFGPRIYERCRAGGLSEQASEDVTQEVFRAVFRGLGSFRKACENHSFRGWLWTIANNTLRDHFRKRRAEGLAPGGSTAMIQIRAVADEFADSSSTHQLDENDQALAQEMVDAAEQEFTQRVFRAFFLKEVCELDVATIAEQLEMSSAAVRQAAYRVRRYLKQQFGDRLDRDETLE